MDFNLSRAAAATERFALERDWHQFHSLRNLVMALQSELGELAELVMWKDSDAVRTALDDPNFRARVAEEIADIQIYLIRAMQVAQLDPSAIVEAKIAQNARKYPVELARGTARKYTELGGQDDGSDSTSR